MTILTEEQFKAIDAEVEVHVTPLLPGLTAEKVVLIMLKRTDEMIEFAATLFGVTIGTWTATLQEGVVAWQTH